MDYPHSELLCVENRKDKHYSGHETCFEFSEASTTGQNQPHLMRTEQRTTVVVRSC